MDIISFLFSFILNIDENFIEIIAIFGYLTYIILFLIIFVETGIVIFPFLPGDSLLFASGTFAALGSLHISLLIVVFISAAVIGDAVNYFIGQKIGGSVVEHQRLGRLINKEKMKVAEDFFNRHGGITIVIARFMPFIRT